MKNLNSRKKIIKNHQSINQSNHSFNQLFSFVRVFLSICAGLNDTTNSECVIDHNMLHIRKHLLNIIFICRHCRLSNQKKTQNFK